MWPLLGMLILFLFILAALVGAGMGVGFLLHWIAPTIDMGIGTLIGVLAVALAFHFLGRLMAGVTEMQLEEESEDTFSSRTRAILVEPIVTRRPRPRKRS